MRVVARWLLTVGVMAHGLLHLLGAAKGLGWADVAELPQPVSAAMGAAWLAAAAVVVAAGVLVAVAARGWWIVAAVGAVVSQAVIVTSGGDAAAGTVGNVVLLAAAGYGFVSQGPTSFRAEYGTRVAAALADPPPAGIVTDADLAHLPEPVAAYVRQSGAVGQPRVSSFRARFHGRIRGSADKPWMTFTGEQVNTYGARPSRLFFMDATMSGLPVDVLHVCVGPQATMRAKACSIVPVLDAAGFELNRAETVTLFNDLCLLAPAALADAPVAWRTIDERHVLGHYANGAHTVTAELVFDDHGQLVDFVSDDRLAASPDGKQFTRRRWSTPVADYRVFGARRVATHGEGRWHATEAAAAFTYLEFHLDDITYNVGAAPRGGTRTKPALSTSA